LPCSPPQRWCDASSSPTTFRRPCRVSRTRCLVGVAAARPPPVAVGGGGGGDGGGDPAPHSLGLPVPTAFVALLPPAGPPPANPLLSKAALSTLLIVTTRSAHPTKLGGGRARPCRRVVLSGNTRPGKKKPKSTHTRRRPGEGAPSDKHELWTGRLLARVEGLEATLTLRPLIPSVPLGPSENPPQTPSKDPRKPSSDTLNGPSENPPQTPLKCPRKTLPSGPTGPVSAEDGRSFDYRLE